MNRAAVQTLIFMFLLASTSEVVGKTVLWGPTGHKVIGSICYRRLPAEKRIAFVKILKQHPRYHQDFFGRMPEGIKSGDEEQMGEWLFQQAALWPDMIQSDGEYGRRTWHYYNGPLFLTKEDQRVLNDEVKENLSIDLQDNEYDDKKLNVVQAIKNSRRVLASKKQSDQTKAVYLCWMMHCIGDEAQPLHAAAMFSRKLFPNGDKGGNAVRTIQRGNLHSVWDGGISSDGSFRSARNRAIEMLADVNANKEIEKLSKEFNPAQWQRESYQLAKTDAYSREVTEQLNDRESKNEVLAENPISLSPNYLRNVQRTSYRQVLVAGVRLTNTLAEIDLEQLDKPDAKK